MYAHELSTITNVFSKVQCGYRCKKKRVTLLCLLYFSLSYDLIQLILIDSNF